MTAATLTDATARLIAAEHLLSQHLPEMRSMDRLKLVCELRDLLDGTTPVEDVA